MSKRKCLERRAHSIAGGAGQRTRLAFGRIIQVETDLAAAGVEAG